MVAVVAIHINPSLNVSDLAARYAPKKRVQIPEFLAQGSAAQAHAHLGELPWGLAYNEGSRVVQLSPDRVASLQDAEAAAIMSGIRERARMEYQFLYAFFPLLTAYFSPSSPRFGIFDVYEFINSPQTLNLIREVTGLSNIRWADGQATWFKPGHFLKSHTDEEAATGRVAAYVMNMSPVWERDWGGFLQFFDGDNNIETAFKPRFNTLNIFTIPQLHSVSMVANYVTAERLSITGWFRSDEPIRPIGRR